MRVKPGIFKAIYLVLEIVIFFASKKEEFFFTFKYQIHLLRKKSTFSGFDWFHKIFWSTILPEKQLALTWFWHIFTSFELKQDFFSSSCNNFNFF